MGQLRNSSASAGKILPGFTAAVFPDFPICPSRVPEFLLWLLKILGFFPYPKAEPQVLRKNLPDLLEATLNLNFVFGREKTLSPPPCRCKPV
jgi:hypothetical protein